MKVFISWSGESSHKIALILRDWLPVLIPSVEPWVSSEDIEKGERWGIKLAQELEQCTVGIICVDSSNINSPWLNFEAGALSKSINTGKVLPLVLGIKPSDIRGPLSQFQITAFEKDDIRKLAQTLNQYADVPMPNDKLEKLINYSWLSLQEAIAKITEPAPRELQQSNTNEISKDGVEILLVLAKSHEISKTANLALTTIVTETKFPNHKVLHYLSEFEKRKFVTSTPSKDYWYIKEPGTSYLIEHNLL